MKPVLAALLLAAAQTGGPPTTIITPGAETRTLGATTPTPPLNPADALAPQTGQLPNGRPDTAQRPTPDQSR